METLLETWRASAYVPLENAPLVSALCLARAKGRKYVALNDGFGAELREAVLAMTRKFLDAEFPVKSRFEL